MGRVTVFVRSDCPYCKRVVSCLQNLAHRVLHEINPSGSIEFDLVSCDEGANALLCARLTSSLAVPHVFFQTEYVGDGSTTCALAGQPSSSGSCGSAEETNLILSKLIALSREPSPAGFPLAREPAVLRVTEELGASSGLPTRRQLESAADMGFRSVVSLLRPEEKWTDDEEERILARRGVTFASCPVGPDLAGARDALARLRTAPKPCLIHCDTGLRSRLICLIWVLSCAGETQESLELEVAAERLGLQRKLTATLRETLGALIREERARRG